MHRVRVGPLPAWLPWERLLGDGDWDLADGWATTDLPRRETADLMARLRGTGFGGEALTVDVHPKVGRPAVRAARTEEARRRRDASPGFTRKGVRSDRESRVGLTPEALAVSLGRRAGGAHVLDATCGIGGNTIGFARAGCTVTAIEIEADRLAMARHNAGVYGVADRITFVRADALDHVGSTDADLVFVDPPWGGAYDRVRTGVADLPLLEAVLARRADRLWAKVPPSFDPTTTGSPDVEAVFGIAPGDRRRVKFLVLRF